MKKHKHDWQFEKRQFFCKHRKHLGHFITNKNGLASGMCANFKWGGYDVLQFVCMCGKIVEKKVKHVKEI